MFIIGEIAVDESVSGTKFACDLNACKGACCTFPGGRGAPLSDDEVELVRRHYPAVQHFLPPEHRAVIGQHGLTDGGPGNYATQCVDGKACVFVYYDEEIAKCAFERGNDEGLTDWRKPLSCHLFPLRVRNHGTELHYEYFSECAPALERGKAEDVDVHRFVAAPLVRAFGKEWYTQLNETIGNRND